MNTYRIFVATLAVITSGQCGVIERGLEVFGEAAHLAHEGAADMFLTGKDILFGKGIRAGPDPVDHGIIPGMAHKIGDGFHLFGAGVSHVFAGDDEIHSPLAIMKDKLAHEAATGAANLPASPVGTGEAAVGNVPVPPVGAAEVVGAAVPPVVGPGVAEAAAVVPKP